MIGFIPKVQNNYWKTSLLFLFVTALIAGCHSADDNIDHKAEVTAKDSLVWHWESDFSDAEKSKLAAWIEEVFDATEETLGDYPFDIHVYFKKSNNESSPVSFGLATRKKGKNMIRLYVNPSASREELLANWTAPHELSHLSIPFLGKESRWFSEGFATYLSRKIMMTMGYYTAAEFDTIYRQKIAEAKPYFNSGTSTFIEVADSLASKHIYTQFYWGSASFFMTLDNQLKQAGKMPFIDIIKAYQVCCRAKDEPLRELIKSFDQIIGEPMAQELMIAYRNNPSNEILKEY